jgi:hypothetical protein
MGLRVWVVEEQTHAHVPVGFPFEPINKPMGREIEPNSYPNRAKTYQISDSGYPLSSLTAEDTLPVFVSQYIVSSVTARLLEEGKTNKLRSTQ